MTREEFNNTQWGVKTKCIVNGIECDIVSIDFGEALIALDVFDDVDNPTWFRCESVELVK